MINYSVEQFTQIKLRASTNETAHIAQNIPVSLADKFLHMLDMRICFRSMRLLEFNRFNAEGSRLIVRIQFVYTVRHSDKLTVT